jgi:hypothetical protein
MGKPQATELYDINELMDWEAIEHLLDDIHAKRRDNSVWPLCLCSRRYYGRAGIA